MDGVLDTLNAAATRCPKDAGGTLVGHPRIPQPAARGLGDRPPDQRDAASDSGYFAGVIDEVRIWNVARTACARSCATKNAEITSGTGLIGRWGLNENTGTSAANSIAGSEAGTLKGTVGLPAWVAGFAP